MSTYEQHAAVLPGMTFHNPIIKDRVTFLQTAASSGGKCTKVLVELAPDGGNSMHRHMSFTETFTPVKGVLGVQVGREILNLANGHQAVADIGRMHRFFNPSKEETILFEVDLTPASEGFEKCIAYAYGLAEDGLTNNGMPKRPADMAVLAHWAETYTSGLMGLIMRLLSGWGARVERREAVQERLAQYIAKARHSMQSVSAA